MSYPSVYYRRPRLCLPSCRISIRIDSDRRFVLHQRLLITLAPGALIACDAFVRDLFYFSTIRRRGSVPETGRSKFEHTRPQNYNTVLRRYASRPVFHFVRFSIQNYRCKRVPYRPLIMPDGADRGVSITLLHEEFSLNTINDDLLLNPHSCCCTCGVPCARSAS